MVGTGYVGLVSGTCFAEFGVDVVCIDREKDKIKRLKKGEVPIYEPGLDDLLARQIKSKRIHFTTELDEAVKNADAVFIAVGTPPRSDNGHADLSHVYEAARQVARAMEGYTVIVTKSTVPVGTAREIERIVREENPDSEFDVASNPEFLREGAAVSDFMRPDRVVIGTSSERAQKVLKEIYRPLYLNETPILFTKRETAEIIKYAANAFLATKIGFINEIADLCEKAGGDVQVVAKALGLDGRISPKFLHAGPGYGGSCFPKDTLALAQTGQKLGARQKIVETVVESNVSRREDMARRIIESCGGNVSGKKIGILGVAFKPGTDDMREAPALSIIPILQEAGAQITAFDPAAMGQAKEYLNDIDWKKDAYEVADGADVLVIITEWNEFRALDLNRIGDLMNEKRLIDLRNIYQVSEMETMDFHYVSIGRPEVLPAKKSVLKEVSGA